MQLFGRQRDLDFFNTIAKSLVEDVIETPIFLYKMAVQLMEVDDLYGDSVNKVYYQPIQLYGLIEHSDETVENTEIGIDSGQTIVANFQRDVLRSSDVYPEIGDIIEWADHYYEIDNINENKIVAGQQSQNYNYTIQCYAHLTRQSKIQIEEFRVGTP